MTPTKQSVLDEYLAFRSLDCKSEDGIGHYRRYISRFLESFDSFDDYTSFQLVTYAKMISENYKQTTVNIINPLLKNFIKWKYPNYSLKFPTLDKILKTKKADETHSPEEMISLDDIMKLVEAEDDLFWKVFWLVFAYGDFRPIDTARLKWGNFHWQEDDGSIVVKVVIGKNNKRFYKHLPASIVPLIDKWKSINPHEKDDWIFPSPKLKGRHINSKTPSNRLSSLSLKVLGKKVIPYVIRHSVSTILYSRDDLPDDITADQAGHHKSMKEIYNHMDDVARTARSKKVWTTKDEMPVEKKEDYEKRIANLEGLVRDLIKMNESNKS